MFMSHIALHFIAINFAQKVNIFLKIIQIIQIIPVTFKKTSILFKIYQMKYRFNHITFPLWEVKLYFDNDES